MVKCRIEHTEGLILCDSIAQAMEVFLSEHEVGRARLTIEAQYSIETIILQKQVIYNSDRKTSETQILMEKE